MSDFLLEIGCEEIPARMLEGASADLAERVAALLDAGGLARGEVRRFATPRRLAVLVENVAGRAPDRDEELTGPPLRAAYDASGRPTKAATGFAEKAGVPVEALRTVTTPKGEYLAARRRLEGRPAPEIVGEALPAAVSGMSFPKTMRWGDGARRFVRPVHWIVALLGEEVVPCEIFGVAAGRESRGARFRGAGRVVIAAPGDYLACLERAGVIAGREDRREALARRLDELAAGAGVRPVEDPGLLEEVADLVEHPGAVLGSFDEAFLSLPREILVTALRHHQKSFSTESGGGLAARFLSVADRDGDPEGHVRRGNEWVVAGRLEDARFFWEEDRKVPMASRRERLGQVTFHARAGSYADKAGRLERLALDLARRLREAGGPGADEPALREAARLAKCDLTCSLVGEFPELQGIAGGLYLARESAAGKAGHPAGTAEAVYDQYRPAGAKDSLPRTIEGALLSLADRLDTLAVLGRCVGLPSGSRDPFALRRAAFGAIRLAAETPLALSLGGDLIGAAEAAAEGVAAGADGAGSDELLGFLKERLEFWLKERGGRYDTVSAVLGAGDGTRLRREPVPRLVEKVLALERVRELPDLAALVEIHKRCRNILDQAGASGRGGGGAAVREDPEEPRALAGLASGVGEAENAIGALMKQDAFEEALQGLVRLRPALSDFFDHVLVMHPDAALRKERLALVGRTAALIEAVADLKEIAISREEMRARLGQLAGGRRDTEAKGAR